MSLRDRIPVEPLDGPRLERIEQRVVAEAAPLLARPRRSPWASWLVAGAAAAAAAAVVIALGIGRRDPRPATTAVAAAPVVVATDHQATRIDLGDALVDVGPDTRFEVVRVGGGVDLQLAAGDISLEVAPRKQRPPLWVHAGDVAVRVVGTGFRVHRHATVEVEVTHGLVEVSRGAVVAQVAGGHQWSSVDGAVVALAAAEVAPARPAAAAVVGSTISAGALALGPTGGGHGLHDRRAALVPDPAAAGSSPDAAAGPPGARADLRPRRRPTGERTTPAVSDRPPPDLRTEIVAQSIAAAPPLSPDVMAIMPDARALAYQRALARGRGPEADAAMWGLARTQAIELGEDVAALRTLDGYVSRFPAGANLEPVLWLRVRLLCKRSIDEPCRAAAHTYVAHFAGTPRGDLATRATESH